MAIVDGASDRVEAEVERLVADPPSAATAARARTRSSRAQSFDVVAAELDRRLREARRASAGSRAPRRTTRSPGRDWLTIDLHLHTDWSHDCSIPAEDLLDHAEEIGLGGIAVTDHNVFGGALEAVELARSRDLVVIPGEEVKTDSQGEVIGLFLDEEIPRGMTFADTVAAIREQGGLVYLPHPFDRLHAIPDPDTIHRHLAEIDVFEVYNARLLRDSFNDEALRFARKYRLLQGAGSDAHVLQGVGTGVVRMRRFDGPGGVPALSPLGRDPAPAEVARLPPVPQVGGPGQGKGPLREKGDSDSVPASVSTDEIYERYLKKAISEINELGDELARAGDELRVPVVGSGHPLADIMLLKFSPQPAEIQEGVAFFGRSGQAVLKSLQRLHVDPMSVYGTNCLKFGTEDPPTPRRG